MASLEVVRFCLGSAAYRRDKERVFLDSVAALPGEPLAALLDGAHLGGLFAALAGQYGAGSPPLRDILARMAPELQARALFNSNIMAELLHLSAGIAAAGSAVHPVVLKGIATWSTYYDDPMARRVRDLDLLIEDPDHADVVCDVLEREGYEGLFFVGDDRSARQHFRTGDSYSVPPYRIRRRAQTDGDIPPPVRAMLERHGPGMGLDFPDEGGPVVTIDVELHRALFTTTEGEFATLLPQDIRASERLGQFSEMTPAAALAYTAVKLAHDVLDALGPDGGGLKCLKLAADLVRILERCGQPEFNQAIGTAARWNCLHHFIDSLQGISALVPEINLAGLPPSNGEASLELLLGHAFDPRETVTACSV